VQRGPPKRVRSPGFAVPAGECWIPVPLPPPVRPRRALSANGPWKSQKTGVCTQMSERLPRIESRNTRSAAGFSKPSDCGDLGRNLQAADSASLTTQNTRHSEGSLGQRVQLNPMRGFRLSSCQMPGRCGAQLGERMSAFTPISTGVRILPKVRVGPHKPAFLLRVGPPIPH
jgi:hypothetical protein